MVTIQLEKIIVGFKTNPQYYHPESDGRKNNTIREIDWEDSRFLELMLMEVHSSYGFIEITSTEREDFKFKRRIKNITIWKGLMIITWKPSD